MALVKINVNTDEKTKEQAQKLFSDLGLDMTTAINMFLKRSLLENGIPFAVSANVPNAQTLAAFDEVADMEKNPHNYKSYKNVKDLRAALGV